MPCATTKKNLDDIIYERATLRREISYYFIFFLKLQFLTHYFSIWTYNFIHRLLDYIDFGTHPGEEEEKNPIFSIKHTRQAKNWDCQLKLSKWNFYRVRILIWGHHTRQHIVCAVIHRQIFRYEHKQYRFLYAFWLLLSIVWKSAFNCNYFIQRESSRYHHRQFPEGVPKWVILLIEIFFFLLAVHLNSKYRNKLLIYYDLGNLKLITDIRLEQTTHIITGLIIISSNPFADEWSKTSKNSFRTCLTHFKFENNS